MKYKNGYTLIELVITIALVVIVLVGGTSIFYRSLQSGKVNDSQVILGDGLRLLGNTIERNARFARVLKVSDSSFRDDCLNAGNTGVVGNKMTIVDTAGGETTYGLSGTGLASNSAVISDSRMTITKFEIAWYCKSGVSDRISLIIEGKLTDGGTIINMVDSVKKDILLLNSGIN